jgi:hypothetical protein
MRSTVIAIVLCLSAAAAAAQCIPQETIARDMRPAPELIKTSGGDSRTQALPQDDGLPAVTHSPDATPSVEDSRRTSPEMLFAALALMSGIALRRFSARMQ